MVEMFRRLHLRYNVYIYIDPIICILMQMMLYMICIYVGASQISSHNHIHMNHVPIIRSVFQVWSPHAATDPRARPRGPRELRT